jgi:hypothetical protein
LPGLYFKESGAVVGVATGLLDGTLEGDLDFDGLAEGIADRRIVGAADLEGTNGRAEGRRMFVGTEVAFGGD